MSAPISWYIKFILYIAINLFVRMHIYKVVYGGESRCVVSPQGSSVYDVARCTCEGPRGRVARGRVVLKPICRHVVATIVDTDARNVLLARSRLVGGFVDATRYHLARRVARKSRSAEFASVLRNWWSFRVPPKTTIRPTRLPDVGPARTWRCPLGAAQLAKAERAWWVMPRPPIGCKVAVLAWTLT